MANIKISELNELYGHQRAYDDYIPVVDSSADETKKISVKGLIPNNVNIIAVTSIAPVEYETGDKYYNTTENKIYTALSTGWGNAETPIEGILYIILEEQKSYTYDGDNETLVSVGGGSGGETLPVGTEVDFDGVAQDIPDGWEQITNPNAYSTNEVKTNKVWIDGKPIYRVCKNVGALPNNGRIQPTFEGIIPANVMVTSLSGIAQKNNGDSYDCRPIETMTTLLMYRPHLYSLYIDTNQDFSSWEGIITIEYTKASS